MPSSPNGKVVVHVFGRTDVGRTREHNEDSFVVADLSTDNATLQPEVRTHLAGAKGTLFMVADGMGGAAAGEIASAMATDLVLNELRVHWVAAPESSPEAFAKALKQAAKTANTQINQFALGHPEYRGMGTTATIAGLLGDTLFLAQVGDSRGYLIRAGRAIQITKDQSLMQKLVEAGELTEEEAEHSDRRNIILQALGPEASIKVDLTHQQVRRDDMLVLCSDGLSTQIGRDEIAHIVSTEPDLKAACKRLIDQANENGGPDNITAIIARFDGEGLAAPGVDDVVGHRVFPLPDGPATPPMPLDRLITATQPIPNMERPTPVRDTRKTVEDVPPQPPPPTRPRPAVAPRSRGVTTIVIAGLLLLVVGSAWYLWSTIRSH
ncbi:MAG TPA: Stp1/IreP family PP2C-type Ser/Thr phosphatase [Gemmatimonadaceae bacterium]|nr:Stp1/IreP family PP2C-type Ser/Thr phosphatase [Gemmatimonadaceae bacterium]